ncbi:MAG: NAD(P)/FAD-dependent oxidoreductase [Gammaproteobacteria bacterium]|nr:NAD(P)/FAD-dependent oxidoreductase [Gammaproteobacteria bacterium]
MTDDIQTLIIGAGVVGLACAAALADSGREVLVLERNTVIGEETSARNSGVVHAGIYYPPGSAKARLCVAGKERIYAYCKARGVPVKRTGKLIAATNEQDVATLGELIRRGHANGVTDLALLDGAEALTLEPELHCLAAIHSPSTGILDTHQLMLALLGELESLGGMVSLGSRVGSLTIDAGSGAGHRGTVETGRTRLAVNAREIVNCAGLQAVPLARGVDGSDGHGLPEAFYTRGNYFRISGRSPFSHLVYPVPEPGGLGIHLTVDMAGTARFGPDVEAVNGPGAGYAVDARRAGRFYASIRRYWPALPDGALLPDYAGIRPKIRRPGRQAMDFEILGRDHHGVPGLVHCLGIESPGLTSCLAIADEVVRQLGTSS